MATPRNFTRAALASISTKLVSCFDWVDEHGARLALRHHHPASADEPLDETAVSRGGNYSAQPFIIRAIAILKNDTWNHLHCG
jgi:hypothetical protein